MRPPSPAGGPAARPKSTRASVGASTSARGWLGERGARAYSSGGVAAMRGDGGGASKGDEATGGADAPLTRAQIALMRHQERMDRIKEKREQRKNDD